MTDEPDAPEPVQLPTKTINPDDDLDDRLTSNVTAQIGPSRYFAKDDTGQPVEDWDGVFERVAQNVAIAEAVFHDVPISLGRNVLSDWVDEDTIDEFFGDSEYAELSEEIAPYVDYDNLVDLLEGAPEDIHDRTVETKNEFESMMREQRFMPNSPTLMNAGRELQQLSACISGDTPIYTRTGLKRMDEITVGDEVLTHKGRFKEVTAHWSNGVKDTLDVKRGGKGDNYSVTATPDHEFLTDDGWAELQDTDSAVQPVALPDTETPDTFDLTKYTSVMNKDKPVVSDGGVVKVQNGDDPRTGAYDKQYSEVVAEVENTESFAYLAGAFLAEGDVDGSDVRFTIGSDEDEFEDDIVSALEDAFGVHVAVMESSYGQWKTITASSPFIADLFRTVFGTGVTEKTVPEWVFASDKAYQQSLLDGLLDGDGHELESGWELTLANPTLCYEATLMARNLGHDVSFTLEAENELSANPTSRAYISKKGGRTALKHIDTTSGSTQEVYDMEVADDHSFVAGDFVVHNCFVVEPGDAMTGQAPDGRASIMSAAEQAAGVFKSGGGVGYPFHLLRPKGARIESTDGVSSGPLSFMEIFDTTCGTVEQGGCVSTNERVMTEEGYKRLGDIHDGLALSTAHTDARVRTRDGLDDVITSSDSGELPSVRVETEHGYELTVTPNHELLVLRGGELEFVEAGELDNTDTLVLDQSDKTVPVVADLAPPDEQEAYHHNAQTVPVENYPDTLTPDMAWVLGALWGDGTTRLDENEVVFSLGHDEQVAIDRVVGFFTDLGLDVSTYDRSGSGKGDYTRVQVRSAQLADWFEQNGFVKGALDELPEVLYQSPNVFTDFLGGLTVDATLVESGSVSYSTADESFAKTIQDLLLAVGIPSKLTTVGAQSDRYSDDASYRVGVTPGAGATRFFKTVDHRFETTPETSSGQRQNQVTDAGVVERILDEHFEKNKMLADGGDRSSMKELRRYERGDRTPSLRRLRSLLGDVGVDPDTYEVLEESNLFVPVDGVVDVGPQVVCDIENKSGQPEFIASNVVVHNKRRGAQMGIMHVQHPDIGRFCVSKRGEDTLTNFNISAGISDEFREAVKKDETVRFIDPETGFPNPDTFEVVPETAHFYDPEFADSWNDQFDKPGVGYDGKQVEENFWRDYLEYMADPEAFEQYRDQISLEPGEPMELPAGFVWQLMVDGAYNNGEPGFVYLDEINEHHSVDVEENPDDIIHATNPCVTGDTLVHTPDGLRRADAVSEGDEIATVLGTESVDEKLTFEDQTVYEVELSDGGRITATPDHRFHVVDGKDVDDTTPLRDLNEGDHIRLEPASFADSGDRADYIEQFRRGILVGDGSYSEKTVAQNNRLAICFDERNETYIKNVRELFESAGYRVGEADTSSDGHALKLWVGDAQTVLDDHGLDPARSHEKDVDVTDFSTESGAQGFLDGLLVTDGNINLSTNRPQIRWTTSSEDLAQTIRTLSLQLGMHGRIYTDARQERGGTRADGSGIETKRYVHDVHIAGESAGQFASNTAAGDYHPSIGEKLITLQTEHMSTGGLWKAKVTSIEKLDETETVYDLFAPTSDTWITEGYVNRGCAEQPLSNYEACNLGHVNLSLMVDEDAEPFDQWLEGRLPDFDDFADGEHVRDYLEHALDTDQLAMTARNGARFLDNVVTMSKFPLEEIEEVVHNQRKIGLGLMGFHQMLLQMGVEYGSGRSYKVAREIMRIIDEHATEESRLLAEERGVYGNWADSKYADPEQYPDWIEQHAHVDADDVDGPIKIRNHKQTTIAPTGTTSMIGNTTGGCEPLYNVAYFKNVGDDIQGDEMLVEFDDYFLDTLEANGISPDAVREEATELMMDNQFDGVDDLDTVPDNIARLFVTTEDLSVEQHIRVQAAFQEYCSSSISKTLNMANDVGLDDVSDAIDLALQLGIKGATIYRVNSRSEEVKTTSVTGGGVTVPEANADTLVDEVTGRLDADELDDETRDALIDALDVDTESASAPVEEQTISLSQD